MSNIEYTVKVFADGTKLWHLNGKLHRADGPAIEYANGSREWLLNGKLHRADGPAVEVSDGSKSWYLEGTKLTESEFLARTQPAKQLTVAEVESMLGFKVEIVS
jgi:hypothetical protein